MLLTNVSLATGHRRWFRQSWNAPYHGPVGQERGARTAPRERRRAYARRSSGPHVVSTTLPVPRAVPPPGRRRDYRRTRPTASICARQGKAVDRPTHKLTGSPMGRDGIALLTPGKLHRSGPTGQEMGEGRGGGCCCAVEASPGPPLCFGRVCNDSRGRQAGLGLPELAWLELLVERYRGVCSCTCGC